MVHPSQDFRRKEKLLQNEVQYITREISESFVVEPLINEVESDLLIGIKFLSKWKIILGCMLFSLGPCELHTPPGVPAMTTDRKAHPEDGCNVDLFTGYVG